LSLQAFDGSWKDPQALLTAAAVRVECPSELAGQPAVFATALAIALLRKRFQANESQWRMIERKALMWLSARGSDPEAIVAALIALL
jgi:hypothetical protein